MTYQYDASGNRVIREQSDLPGSSIADIYQDVYLGGTERRHVQLRNQWNEAVSIHSTEQDLTFANIENTKELHYAAGVRIQWDGGSTGGGLSDDPQIFLSFNNHLGSTSAVIDFKTGDLVEWNTNYAYGADESRWKNDDPKYDNAEEPYGFTGKEEDKAVGLHYFGARYYSSYLGRWLSPDPPVIHGGGLGNHYNYGGNSPYIYVDPDGNSITALIIGAVVGAAVSAVTTAIKGGSAKDVLMSALKGAAVGLATGIGAACIGAIGGAMVSAGISMAQTARAGGSMEDVMLSGAIAFGSGAIGAGMGQIGAGVKGVGAAFGRKVLSFATGLATAYGAAALTGGLNKENWDDILKSYSINFAVSSAANGVAGKIQEKISKSAGMGGHSRTGGAVGSSGDDAGYSSRGSHFSFSDRGKTVSVASGAAQVHIIKGGTIEIVAKRPPVDGSAGPTSYPPSNQNVIDEVYDRRGNLISDERFAGLNAQQISERLVDGTFRTNENGVPEAMEYGIYAGEAGGKNIAVVM